MAGPFICPTCHLELAAPAASCEQHLRDEIATLRERLAQAEAEHGKALAAVRATEAQFHAFLNNSPCVAFVRDLEGRLIYYNEPYRRVLQRGKESMLGTTDGERFPPEVSEQLRRNNELVWKSNRPIEVIEEVPGADGVLRPWLVFKFPVPDAAGRRLLGGVAIDIGERRRIEEQLRESEEFHRLISELSSDYAYRCTVDADGTVRMASVTEGFTRITGYTLEETLARGDWPSLIHPDDLPGAVAELNAWANTPAARQGKPHFVALRIITKDGAVRWIRYSLQYIWDRQENRPVELIGAVQDVTEAKRAEAELQISTQRLSELSRRLLEVQEEERRRLAAELHDEIGQVLTGLKLTLEAAERLPGPAGQNCVSKARQLVQDLMGQVRDLSMGLRPSLLDDLGLLPAVHWHLQRYTAQTGVQVTFSGAGVDRRFPVAVETAAYRIIQESLTNVARHAGVKSVAVQMEFADGRLAIAVKDEGAGFDPARFASGRDSSGLAGMQERARWLGGRLTVESRPGAGTRLTAELPVVQSEEPTS
jgi:PAS domain S-box-containing protein